MAVTGVGGVQREGLSEFNNDDNDVNGYERLGFDELTNMFQELGGVGDANLSEEEAKALADYMLEQAMASGDADSSSGIITVDLDYVMDMLDKDQDDTIEISEMVEFRLEAGETEQNLAEEDTFTLSSSETGDTFKFTFLDEYEDSLANIINEDGSLNVIGLQNLLGTDPDGYEKELESNEVKAVLAMGLMAVGLDESEVTFIMNELVQSPNDGAFQVQDLLDIAAGNYEAIEDAEESGIIFS